MGCMVGELGGEMRESREVIVDQATDSRLFF